MNYYKNIDEMYEDQQREEKLKRAYARRKEQEEFQRKIRTYRRPSSPRAVAKIAMPKKDFGKLGRTKTFRFKKRPKVRWRGLQRAMGY